MKKIYYMSLALTASMRSGCQQAQVGCVLVKDDHVVATGYNGTLPGTPNCDGGLNCQSSYKGLAICLTVHAEANAISQANKSGISLEGASAYVTRYPCLGCAQALILAGVNQIYYLQKNSWVEPVADMLATQAPHVGIEQINPNEVKKLLWSAATSIDPVSPQLIQDSPVEPVEPVTSGNQPKPNGASVNQWLLSETYARPEPIFQVNNPGLPNDGQRVLIDKEQLTENQPEPLVEILVEHLSEPLAELIAKAKCEAMANKDSEQLEALLFLASLLDNQDNQPKPTSAHQEDNRKTAPSWNTKPETNFKPRRGRNA